MTRHDTQERALQRMLDAGATNVSPPDPEGAQHAIRRGKGLRRRRRVGGAIASVLAPAGVLVPLIFLSPLGDRAGTPGSGPGPTTSSTVSPTTAPSPTPSPPFGTADAPPPSFVQSLDTRPGWVAYADPIYSVSVSLPSDWTLASDPKPSIIDPRILFAAGDFSVPQGDECAWLASLPPDRAVIWLSEAFAIKDLGGDPATIATQPARFQLDPGLLGIHECIQAELPMEYDILFQTAGRFFDWRVAFGAAVTDSVREETLDALSSISVQPLP